MPSKNRFEVPVEYRGASEEIEVKQEKFLESSELNSEAVARAREMLERLGNLYQEERKHEEATV